MIKPITLFSFIILISVKGLCQNNSDSLNLKAKRINNQISIDSIKIIYEEEAIYFDGNGNFIKNNVPCKMGFLNRNLRFLISISDEATKEYNLYRKCMTRGLISNTLGIVGCIVILGAAGSPIGAVMIIPIIYSIVELSNAPKHFQKSIWAYNRDILILKIK